MNRCYLSLGSNQNSPERQIRAAIKAIKKLPSTYITKASRLHWSRAWGVEAQQDFCNVVLQIMTTLPPDLLLHQCQKIEKKQGRVRKKHWGPRTIDIDIILYGDRVIKTPHLMVPHPYYKEREFVIKPLLEIAPELEDIYKFSDALKIILNRIA